MKCTSTNETSSQDDRPVPRISSSSKHIPHPSKHVRLSLGWSRDGLAEHASRSHRGASPYSLQQGKRPRGPIRGRAGRSDGCGIGESGQGLTLRSNVSLGQRLAGPRRCGAARLGARGCLSPSRQALLGMAAVVIADNSGLGTLRFRGRCDMAGLTRSMRRIGPILMGVCLALCCLSAPAPAWAEGETQGSTLFAWPARRRATR